MASSRSRQGLGFYCEVEERDDEESECLEIRDGVLEEGVFTVERVVERRRKVSVQFTVAAVKYYIVACMLFIIEKG